MLTRRQARLQNGDSAEETNGDQGQPQVQSTRKPSRETKQSPHAAAAASSGPSSWEPLRVSSRISLHAATAGSHGASTREEDSGPRRPRRASANAFIESLTNTPASTTAPRSSSLIVSRSGSNAGGANEEGNKGDRRVPAPVAAPHARSAASGVYNTRLSLVSSSSYYVSLTAQTDGAAARKNRRASLHAKGGQPIPPHPTVEADAPMILPDFHVTPAMQAALHHWRQQHAPEGRFDVSRLPSPKCTSSGSLRELHTHPYTRVTAAQIKAAWRGCVRDMTTSSGSSSGSVPEKGGRGATLRGYPLVTQKLAQLEQCQLHLSHEIPAQHHLEAHQERMRLLFGAHQDGVSASDKEATHGAADEAGEAAYLKLLNPSRSGKEANILRVISAIDSQLHIQMQSIYKEKEGEATHGPSPLSSASKSTFSKGNRHPSTRLSATHRLALVDALISATTSALPPFRDMLMPYQQEGVRWFLHLNFAERTNGILADDMGLGKTAQTVMYMACYKTLLEGLVERQLRRAMDFTRELLWRCGAAFHSGAGGGSGGCGTAFSTRVSTAQAMRIVEDEERRLLAEVGEVAIPELLPLWPRLSSGEGGADPVHGTQDRAPSTLSSLGAMSTCGEVLRVRLEPYFTAVRTLKELKQWVWQLDSSYEDAATSDSEETEVDTNGGSHASGSAKSVRRGPGPSARKSPSAAQQQAQQHQQQQERLMRHRRRVAPQQTAVVVRRKRGRPSKADLAARAAAVALGGGTTAEAATGAGADGTVSTSASFPSLTPEDVDGFLSDAAAVPGMSRATNASLERNTSMLPILVIAPLSTLPHWRKEFAHFQVDPLFEVYVLNGSRDARDAETTRFLQHVRLRDAQGSGSAGGQEGSGTSKRRSAALARRRGRQASAATQEDREDDVEGEHTAEASLRARTPVLLIPHDLLVRHGLSLVQRRVAHVHYHLVVIDEAQRIKNNQGGLFQKVCRLSSLSRAVLTGTPLQNNVVELFALLQFLAPQVFHNKKHQALLAQLDEALAEASRSHALEDAELHILLCRRVHRLLSPFILRRDKSVIKALLPVKKDFTVVCPLLPYQERKLEEVEERYAAGTLSGNPNILRRKILLHPYTMQPYFYVDKSMLRTSGKLLVLDFMMNFLVRTKHKFLIFCGWTLVLDVVETLCQLRHLPYVRLDGKTSVEDREANIARFNGSADASPDDKDKGEEGHADSRDGRRRASTSATAHGSDAHHHATQPCCFLISKVAGGVGLNLQSADTVFLLDVDYNPQRDNQALSRVYRVGQRKAVRVFRLLIDHPSERGVVAIHEAKEHLDRAVVQAGKYDLHASATEKEAALQELFVERHNSTTPAANGVAGKTWPGDTAATATAAAAAAAAETPVNPSSPVFPFGPMSPQRSTEGKEGKQEEEEGEGTEAFPSLPGDVTAEGGAEADGSGTSALPPLIKGASPSSPTSPHFPDAPLDTSASAPDRPRRVRFALPEEHVGIDVDRHTPTSSRPIVRPTKTITFADVNAGDTATTTTVAATRSAARAPTRGGRKRPLDSSVKDEDVKAEKLGDDEDVSDGEEGLSDGVPLARHLLNLRERLMVALPRSEHEVEVLATMFAEQEVAAAKEEGKLHQQQQQYPSHGPGRRRPSRQRLE